MDSGINYILSLKAVREQAHKVLELAEQGKLTHFNYDRAKLGVAADYVIGIIQVKSLSKTEVWSMYFDEMRYTARFWTR